MSFKADFIPNNENLNLRIKLIHELKDFLVRAPEMESDQMILPYELPTGETLSCIRWQNEFFMTGTDIVRSLVFRFQAFGRPVLNYKKFEEGIFSDLRNLKPGSDAILEEPKSIFLELLFKHNCIRTQKKQKVFYWHAVPHDRLFLDALERDLKREKLNGQPTSTAVAHPATHITLNHTQAMYDEFRRSMLYQMNLESPVPQQNKDHLAIFGQFSLFEGSPTYKQRRRRLTQQHKKPHYIKSGEELKDNLKSNKNFDCPLHSCGKSFKRLEHMKRHLRTHTLERPYLCDYCGKRFSRSDNLAQHKKTHQRIKDIPSSSSSPQDLIQMDMYEDLDLLPPLDWSWEPKIDWHQYYYINSPFLLTPIHTNVNSPVLEYETLNTMSPTDALLY